MSKSASIIDTNMKNKILIGCAALMLAVTAFGQASPQAVYKETPLLNGYNLWLTNSQQWTVGSAQEVTNLFTYIHGEIVYANTNLAGNTNVTYPDPLDVKGRMFSDALGQPTAGIAIHVYMNDTNWVPIAITNSAGQYYIPPAGTTNAQVNNYLGWPPANGLYPTYMYPATTNTYQSLTIASSVVSNAFNFQRGFNVGTLANPLVIWDSSTNLFTFTVVNAGVNKPIVVMTNLPTSFTQGASYIRLNNVTSAGVVGGVTIVNGVWIGQYAP